MKIALISDIHANLPALEAFFRDVEHHQPDALYCMGDLVGYQVWPNEVIAEIRERRIPTLAGNHDEKVPRLEALGQLEPVGKNYAYHIIGQEEKNYLKGLPAHIRLEFQLQDGKFSLLLVHGSPRRIDEYVLEDTPEDVVTGMMQEAGADMLCVGHSHIPYYRVLKHRYGRYRHVINTGSVGKPKDGNPRGCYVLLTINGNTSLADKENIGVEFIRFEYDIEKAAAAIENSPLPDELAAMLRGAY